MIYKTAKYLKIAVKYDYTILRYIKFTLPKLANFSTKCIIQSKVYTDEDVKYSFTMVCPPAKAHILSHQTGGYRGTCKTILGNIFDECQIRCRAGPSCSKHR